MLIFPQVFLVRQTSPAPTIADPAAETHRQLARLKLEGKVRAGQSVAITVGSRKIAEIVPVVRAAVEHLKSLGARPFIVPAMGSHGGGTAEGQRRLVESQGITEATVGCPIRSSVETVVVAQAPEGFPIHFDRLAFEADHVLVFNRVKPHTVFTGGLQSGLWKMLLIGLGKCEGARVYHRAIEDYGFERVVRSVAPAVLAKCHILAGLAVVENAYQRLAHIEAVEPRRFAGRDRALQKMARKLMPRIPFAAADLLLIDFIGKDISGDGLDPNVVGRKYVDHQSRPREVPKIRRIAVRDLTPAGGGNAMGVGLAEFCRSQLLRKMNPEVTRLNALVSGHVTAAMIPLSFDTDRDMLAAALNTVGLAAPSQVKLLWISDTLHLTELACSAAYLSEAQGRTDLEVVSGLHDLPLAPNGNLPLLSAWAAELLGKNTST